MPNSQINVGLFVTCLVDFFRPQVGFATIKLLKQAGCQVSVPSLQTCCGQPAYNSGDRENSQAIARQVIQTFSHFDYIVAPSGSCAGMIKHHYPTLFSNQNKEIKQQALTLANKTYELTSFLVDVLQIKNTSAKFPKQVTYHDTCTGLRELNIKQQPRTLLQSVHGLKLAELKESEVCCGFGGTFCVKYPSISNNMVNNKIQNIIETQADTLLAGDLGCLLNIAGKLLRENYQVHVHHIAEVLADMTDTAPIGEVKS